MGRLSRAIGCCTLAAWCAASAAQVPEGIVGTADGAYELFTPAEVVEAAGSGVAFQFLVHKDFDITTITTSTALPITLDLVAEATYSQGLVTGPFFTAFEGAMSVTADNNRTLTLTVSTQHTFGDGKKLTIRRAHAFRANKGNPVAVPWTSYSSITELTDGATFTADDGSAVTITPTLLAAPVSIKVDAVLSAAAPTNITALAGETAGLTWYQFTPTRGGGGGGSSTPLSNAVPKVESGSGAAGSAISASRGDHVHPTAPRELPAYSASAPAYLEAKGTARAWAAGTLPPVFRSVNKDDCLRVNQVGSGVSWRDCGGGAALSDKTPAAASGTGGAGTGTMASRDDHAHPVAGQDLGVLVSDLAGIEGLSYVPENAPFHFRSEDGTCQHGVLDTDWTAPGAYTLCTSSETVAQSAHAYALYFDNSGDSTVEPLIYPGDQWGDVTMEASNAFYWTPLQRLPQSGYNRIRAARLEDSKGTHFTHRTTYAGDVSGAVGLPRAVPPPPKIDGQLITSVNETLVWQDLFGVLRPQPKAANNGQIVRVAPNVETSTTEFVYDDPHSAVLAGLPALTGHGGNCLKANAAATGVEFAACGGSSGGGGGITWTNIDAFNPTAGSTNSATRTLAGEGNACLAADFIFNAGAYVITWQPRPVKTLQTWTSWAIPISSTGSTTNITNVNYTCRADGDMTIEVWPNSSGFKNLGGSTKFTTWLGTLGGGGNGGGGTTPSIPTPTTAGKLKHLRVNAAGAAYELADPPVPRTPGALVKSIKTGSNEAGTETTYARTDHQHSVPGALYGTPVDIGRTNSAGTATTLARSDHVHEGRTVDVFPSIPNDHADHEYLLIPNKAGNDVMWDHGIDDALQENAADIGAADRRIDDIVTPSFGVPYPQDNFTFALEGCTLNVDTNKVDCKTKWVRPATWERVKLYDNEFSDWSGPTQSITLPTSLDIQAAMQSPVTAYREFEVHLTWAKRSGQQRTIHQTIIRIGGMATNGNFAANDNGVFHSQNSLNSVTGTIGWARLEVNHDAAEKLVVNYNVQGETFVRVILTGVR